MGQLEGKMSKVQERQEVKPAASLAPRPLDASQLEMVVGGAAGGGGGKSKTGTHGRSKAKGGGGGFNT
jgi:hypothetical protein